MKSDRKKTSNAQRPTPNVERRLARRIARYLFTDGCGERVNRLVMEMPNAPLSGSGWSEAAVAGWIERELLRNRKSQIGDRK
jgi:hypothetical protein